MNWTNCGGTKGWKIGQQSPPTHNKLVLISVFKWSGPLGVATKIKVSTVKSFTKEESTMMPDLCLTRKVTDEESGEDRNSWKVLTKTKLKPRYILVSNCVMRAPLLYFIRSWLALSFKVVSQWVSPYGISNTCLDLHFVQYINACMPSSDPVSSITNCYRLIVSYTDPVHSLINSYRTV